GAPAAEFCDGGLSKARPRAPSLRAGLGFACHGRACFGRFAVCADASLIPSEADDGRFVRADETTPRAVARDAAASGALRTGAIGSPSCVTGGRGRRAPGGAEGG